MTHFFILTFLGRLSDRPHSSGDRYRINRIGEKWTDTVWKVSHKKVFDYFEAESKLSLGESEMNISCMLGFW
jgi:hypothetical protein